MACNDIENMCEARGLFINDDGEGVEIDQRTNIYRFHMTFNKGI